MLWPFMVVVAVKENYCRFLMIMDLLILKPVLNWANVCSPNILRTLRRPMIRFLTELLVRERGSNSPNFTSFSNDL